MDLSPVVAVELVRRAIHAVVLEYQPALDPRRRQIHVDDPAVAALHISGEFSADDPMMLVKHLQQIQHVKVTPSATGVVLGSRL
jgi:ferric-dicitrate binding protein FerR (iron transport regulator)